MSILEEHIASSAGIGISASRPDGKEKARGDFLFSKTKDDKKNKKNGKPDNIMNKDSEALV